MRRFMTRAATIVVAVIGIGAATGTVSGAFADQPQDHQTSTTQTTTQTTQTSQSSNRARPMDWWIR